MSTIIEEKKVVPQDATIPKKGFPPITFEGKVVSLTSNALVMTNKKGKEYSYTLAKDVRLTCDGTVCKAENLKAGSAIRVTTKKYDRSIASGIESLDKQAQLEQSA